MIFTNSKKARSMVQSRANQRVIAISYKGEHNLPGHTGYIHRLLSCLGMLKVSRYKVEQTKE